MRYRSDVHRVLLLTALLAVVAGACVQPGPPSVAIDKLEANLVFGVKPAEEPTKPPAQQAIQRAVAEPEEFVLPEFEEFAPDDDDFEFQVTVKPDPCPTASITAAPKVPTEVEITGDPPEGLYRWQTAARIVTQDENGEDQVLSDSGFERRMIRNFERQSETVYTFEGVQPAGDNFLVTTFEVDTAAVSVGDPTAGAGTIESPVRPGEPERGVTVTRIEARDRNDNPIGLPFAPATGILMLPLPVTSGEQYQSVAVDPKGATVVHNATVTRRARVDACGDLVDGWLVEATVAVANPGVTEAVEAGSYRYSYIVATQYGGMLINERIQPADENDDSIDIEFTLGQLDPNPLPPTEEES